MKFTTVFAVLATVATAVSAMLSGNLDTNAKRFAAGMGPLPPSRRSPTRSYGSPQNRPSNSPTNSCNTGSLQCCNTVTNTADPTCRDTVQQLGGIALDPSVPVGMTCSPLSALALNSGACTSQAVCCEDNSYNGVVAIGCSSVNA